MSKKKKSKFCLFCIILLLCSICLSTISYCEPNFSNEKTKKIEAFIKKQMKQGKMPGLAIAIVKNDKTVYQKCFGYKNIAEKKPVTEDTLFELGSTSKAFTGLAILLLEKKGVISLDDPISKYIPWLKMKYKDRYINIKIEQFLHHTSGIPFKSIGNIPVDASGKALENTVRTLVDINLEHYPGEEFLYATINYDVLGLLIEIVSGRRYEEFIMENIIKPFGLNSVYLDRKEAYSKENMATGYKLGFLVPREYAAPTYKGNLPAGYFIMNLQDMVQWVKIQMDAVPVDDFYKDIIAKSHIPDRTVSPTADGSSYAAGWEIYQSGGGEISHSGSNPNFSANIIFRPEEKIGVVVFANINSNYAASMGRGILDILLERDQINVVSDFTTIDNVAFTGFCISSLFILVTLVFLILCVIDIIRKKRKRSESLIKGFSTAIASVVFILCFGYCMYTIPKVLYDSLPWSFVEVWAPYSLIPALKTVFAAVIILTVYFTGVLFFPKENEKALYPLVVLSFVSGFGNALIIFTINEAVNREKAIESGLLLYFFLGIMLYVLGQKIIRTKMIKIANDLIYSKRIELIERVLRTPFYQFERVDSNKIFSGLNNDTEIVSRIPGIIVGVLTSSVTLMCCFIYLGSINLYGLGLSLLIIVCAGSLYYFVGRSATKLWERARDIQNEFFGFINDLVYGFKELSINRSKRSGFKMDIEISCNEYKQKRVEAAKKFADVFVIGELLFTFVIGAVPFVFPILFKDIQRSMMQTYIFVFLYMTGPFHGVLDNIPELFTIRISWNRINELINELEKINLPETQTDFSMEKVKSTELSREFSAIEMNNVEYQYINNDKEFKVGPIDLSFKSGEVTFITGGNGSGKTTLAKLITGLYKADKGEILINGKAVEHQKLGENYSCVFSDYYLFKKLYGVQYKEKVDIINDWLKILEIDKKLTINDGVLSTLKLSSGQRKRLALLMSYIDDKDIFLFDEWAADQDPEFKNYFYTHLLNELRSKNKCIIAITHDDHYYHVADRVIKLDSGKVESIKVNSLIAG